MPNSLFENFPPRAGRAHEAFGAGAGVFAAIVCGLSGGNVIWMYESWQAETLNPNGLSEFVDPNKLLVGKIEHQTDILAASEEALRSGAVSVVVAELTKPLSLTAGRRLQLAAEAGRSTGIFLISEGDGSNAADTRWQCEPVFDPRDSTLQRWQLIKNKRRTLGDWTVLWNAEKRRVIVVPDTRNRSGSENASD